MNSCKESGRVSLRPIALSDTDNIVRWRNSPGVLNYFIDRRLITPESHGNWLETRVFTGEVKQFIIHDKEAQRDIGSVYLRDIDSMNHHCEFGIFIGEEDYYGRGYGSEACRLICDFAFDDLGLNRVFLRVLAKNTGAIKCYKKAGFREEGLFREHAFENGNYIDIMFMGLLKSDR